ncbi:Cystathionine gamma-synthase [Coccomyxa sp. Obi]|nr:Cystathionine gamma-synthase [Coccomyxa sp. Obi]
MPIFQSATYGYSGDGNEDLNGYTRPADSPNHFALARIIATLEGTEGALVLSSGMAAISSTLLTLLRPGDHLLIQNATYGGTNELVHGEFSSLGIEHTAVDPADPASWDATIRPNTKVFYVESISNPLIGVADLEAVAAFCKQRGLTPVVDNTFATPVLLTPARLGFIVVHSATKYLNGHSDIIAGAVAGPADFIAKVREKMVVYGGVLDPHACWLLQRGLATLALRVRQQTASALALAHFLEQHPQVEAVNYPGLPSSPFHSLAQSLFGGSGGGVLSFEVKGGRSTADALLKALTLPLIAPSLGGVESLITIPSATSHEALGVEGRKAAGISESLIRLSVGIEGTEDLLADFAKAFKTIANGSADNSALAQLKVS